MKKAVLSIIILSLLATACMFKPSKVDKTKIVLAEVAGRPIFASDLDSIATYDDVIINDSTDVESLKKVFLDSLIDNELVGLLEDSVAGTLDRDLPFRESRDREVTNVVFRMMYEDLITNKVHIDSTEIDSAYNADKERYRMPEMVKASQILIPPPPPDTAGVKSEKKKQQIIEKEDKETYERAKAVYDKAVAGENWDSLVVKYSQDAMTNRKSGNLGYFPQGRMVAPFDSAAFNTEVGQFAGPVKTKYGYHIIRIDDRKPEGYRELDASMRTEIQSQIASGREKVLADQFLDSLKAEAIYEFNDSALALEDSLLAPETWVMVVNLTDTVYDDRMKRDFPKYCRFHKIDTWTVDDKIAMLKEISATNLLQAAGRKLGYYDQPKAVEAFEEATDREAGIRAKNLLRDLQYTPSEEEINDYYKSHFDKLYKERKPLHVQHIIFEDSAKAAAVYDSLKAGADFKEMALKYYPGEPEIREVAYDLGYISEEELGDDFFKHADQLKEGEISKPFKTEWGYHIVKLVNRRADKKLDQVRPAIRKALTDAADSKVKTKYLDEKRAEVKIKIHDGAIKKYQFPQSLYSMPITP
jgi:peptidyl-prolyl cis-trans isomerase C